MGKILLLGTIVVIGYVVYTRYMEHLSDQAAILNREYVVSDYDWGMNG